MFGLCWHRWTKWHDPFIPNGFINARQRRNCTKCGKVDERYL